jgi:hypothetical protein
MGAGTWLKIFTGVVGGLARRTPQAAVEAVDALAPFETRLLAFAAGAIKKAFDRDSDRLTLEREHLEAERARAEAALRLEWLRQEGDRRFAEARLLGMLGVGVWIVSAIFGVALAARYGVAGKVLLGASWLSLVAAVSFAIVAHSRTSAWMSVAAASPVDPPDRQAITISMWSVVAGFTLAAASMLVAL